MVPALLKKRSCASTERYQGSQGRTSITTQSKALSEAEEGYLKILCLPLE